MSDKRDKKKENVNELTNEISQSENKLTKCQRKHDIKQSTGKPTLFNRYEKEGEILGLRYMEIKF